METGAVLAHCRRRSGLTIRQLAIRGRTSHSAVAAYESGAKVPTLATLRRLIEACGFELDLGVVPIGPFEDRLQRGRELLEVLELADELPHRHPRAITTRFASR